MVWRAGTAGGAVIAGISALSPGPRAELTAAPAGGLPGLSVRAARGGERHDQAGLPDLTDSPDHSEAGAEAVGGHSRRRVLDILRGAAAPLAVLDIAARVGLHPNTVRFHLDALTAAGVVARRVRQQGGPGRPRLVYSAVAEPRNTSRRSYQLLSAMLLSHFAAHSDQPAQAAEALGDAWGRFLAPRPAPFQRLDAAGAVDHLVDFLAELGFSPEALDDHGRRVILVRHCPFVETAREHPEVVCSIHLGLMRGLLSELRAPLRADLLEPFVESSTCAVRLSAPEA